jgi:hypothetical protein
VAAYVFLRVVYEEIEVPRRELNVLKNKMASAKSTERLKGVQLAATLRGLETRGLVIRKEIARAFLPNGHKGQVKAWQDELLAVIKREAPAHQDVDEFAAALLRRIADADIRVERGLPVFPRRHGAPTLTVDDVDRLADGSDG